MDALELLKKEADMLNFLKVRCFRIKLRSKKLQCVESVSQIDSIMFCSYTR